MNSESCKTDANNDSGEMEVADAQSVVEERREDVYVAPLPALPPPQPSPVIVDVGPPPPPPVEMVQKTTVVRDVSPARSVSSYTTSTSRAPVVVNTTEVSNEVGIGPMALVGRRRSRSRSGRDREIRSEIRALEAELKNQRRHDKEIVRSSERLSSGELVLYEERVEKVEDGHKGLRVEKDKKGRMSISVPRYR